MLGARVGNYVVSSHLGAGAMGDVYRAEHPEMGRRAVVKIIQPKLATDAAVVARFFNEARAAAATRHPNVIDVFDLGYLDNGAPYILMEFLDGRSLRDALSADGLFSISRVADVVSQASDGLMAVHQQQIVHRDLKPDNLYLVNDDMYEHGARVKVLDFGVAKLGGALHFDGPLERTSTGAYLGTPLYMAPEQFGASKDADARCDQYALAVVAYELICGHTPHKATSLGDLVTRVQSGAHTPLSQLRADVPRAVDKVIARALSVDPARRYATVGAFAAALKDAAASPVASVRAPVWRWAVPAVLVVGAAGIALFARSHTQPLTVGPPPAVVPPLPAVVPPTPARAVAVTPPVVPVAKTVVASPPAKAKPRSKSAKPKRHTTHEPGEPM